MWSWNNGLRPLRRQGVGNLKGRLARLERQQPAPQFSPWDWLQCPEDAPPGWELPAEWQEMLAELPDGPVADVIAEEIARAYNFVPDAELLAQNEKPKSALGTGTHNNNNGEQTEDRR
jgi:hypothetical protein